jgi:hypothetical protein
MRPEKYTTQSIVKAFQLENVLTIDFLKRMLRYASKRTIIRRIAQIGCLVSYSHSGKYYTLDRYVHFDQFGLWSFHTIHFSKCGTLINTIVQFVNSSEGGYFAYELEELLKVRVHNCLTYLYNDGRLLREQLGRHYLYLSPVLWEQQLERREQLIKEKCSSKDKSDIISGVIQESMHFLLSFLDEKQRRLYLGLESMRLGHGGDSKISQITGVNIKTVARGRQELHSRGVTPDGIRRAGAGRPSLKKKPRLSSY